MERRRLSLAVGAVAAATLFAFSPPPARVRGDAPPARLDPAAWGADHVGEPVPEYMTGGECLFCHRVVGGTWHRNPHHRTIRELEPGDPMAAALKHAPLAPFAEQASLVLGGRRFGRYLRKSPAYGKVDLLSSVWERGEGEAPPIVHATGSVSWDAKKFGQACAGCHASGVDSLERTFSSVSLDCYTCHGEVDEQHANDTSLILFAKKRKDPARVEISICASCHVRTGKSRSTGLPFANNFVPGDNVFRDLEVDFSKEALAKLDPGDRHVLENVRDVALLGKTDLTCTTCHDVHKSSSKKHRFASNQEACVTCHAPGELMEEPIRYTNHSKVCEY